MQHVLSVEQFDQLALQDVFNRADALRLASTGPQRQNLADRYLGYQMCSLFYEPSTRTRVSFETAAAKLGLSVVSTENAGEFSSAAKGETLEDTIRVLNEYDFSAIVLRHKETGAADRAATVSRVPIINAGDGKGEHPTQALLDAYTIKRKLGTLNGLNVVLGGDLKHGRTARSLAKLLSQFSDNHINFVSTEDLRMDGYVKGFLRENQTGFEETTDMYDALSSADVVYWTRLQTERLKSASKAGRTGFISKVLRRHSAEVSNFVIDARALEVMQKGAIIMHPLPRVGEITQDVDQDPRAIYFEQAGNGLYIRMALLDMIMSDK